LPQAPQFAASVFVLVQVPLHAVRPIVQVAAQTPALHTWPARQALPHEPQFFASVATSTQTPPQVVCPVAQPHLPAAQI
jgi:hypothetical protein